MAADDSQDIPLLMLRAAWARRDTTSEAVWDALFKHVMGWSDTELVSNKISGRDYPLVIYRYCVSWLKSSKYGYIAEWSSSDEE